MKEKIIWCAAALLIILTACTPKPVMAQEQTVTWGKGPGKVVLTKLSDKVWVHTTWFDLKGFSIPSNGLVILTKKGAVWVDTPWTDSQTAILFDGLKKDFRTKTIRVIFTHFHQDRIGGIAELHRRGVETTATALTQDLAVKQGFERPGRLIPAKGETFTIGEVPLEIWFPGPGHTIDNLVVWIPEDGILFGGCLIKEMSANNPGNTADADMSKWADSIKKLKTRYPEVRTVVPGHGSWGGIEMLDHTEKLVR